MEIDGIAPVRDGSKHLPFQGSGLLAAQIERRVTVRRQHGAVKLFAASCPLHHSPRCPCEHALSASMLGLDECRVASADQRERTIDGCRDSDSCDCRAAAHCVNALQGLMHIRLTAGGDNAPERALQDVEQVVVRPEADQHLHWKVQNLCGGN